MSMLTPRGMGGQYKITGKLYPRMTRRRRRMPVVIAIVVGLVVLATAGWGVYHFTSDDSGDKAAACASPTASTPPDAPPAALPEPKTITVNVYNATKRAGLAKTVSEALKARGFVIGKVTNDPLNQPVAATAEIRHGFPGTTPAKVVAAQVAASTVKEDQRTDGSVDLVIGDGWTDLAAPEQVAAILSPPPPPAPSRPPGC
ncbi:LytR C-terminal domain-containing protein [Embleya sp. NPDC020886]|uniref:LytR C-terminal domain-containing protein n=1 Tax=Embleya sp. NPDC020886 TaxID=3363980 RepID=UPI00378AD0D1